MLHTAQIQHLLTGGTGWLRTYRYSHNLCSHLKATQCVSVMLTRTAFLIGLGTRMLQIYEVVIYFFFLLKIVHFHNLGVSLGMTCVYICTRGRLQG